MNPIKGEAELKLKDGRTYKLVLDFEAFVAAESAYGKPSAQISVDVELGFIGAIRAIFFGALQAHHPHVTLRDAAAIMQSDAAAVEAALEEAGKRAYPDPSEDKETGKVRPRRGKPSGRSGAKPASTRNPSGAKPRARSR